MGCEVTPCLSREFGYTNVQQAETRPVLRRRPRLLDRLDEPRRPGPEPLEPVPGRWRPTDTCPNAAVRHHTLPLYGLQFHPEVTHTQFGEQLLANFVRNVCGCHGDWKMSLVHRRADPVDPRAGRHEPRDLRALRRRRFLASRPRCCSRRSARSSRASSSTTACSAAARRSRSDASSASISRPTCTSSTPATSS